MNNKEQLEKEKKRLFYAYNNSTSSRERVRLCQQLDNLDNQLSDLADISEFSHGKDRPWFRNW